MSELRISRSAWDPQLSGEDWTCGFEEDYTLEHDDDYEHDNIIWIGNARSYSGLSGSREVTDSTTTWYGTGDDQMRFRRSKRTYDAGTKLYFYYTYTYKGTFSGDFTVRFEITAAY